MSRTNYKQRWLTQRAESIVFARQAMIALIADKQRDPQQIAAIAWHVSREMVKQIPPVTPPRGWREQCKKMDQVSP